MNFYFKNTKKYIMKTEEKGEDFLNKNICLFCEQIYFLIKLEIIFT